MVSYGYTPEGKMFQSYESTRNSNLKATASEAVLKGIAEDGGLYVMRGLEHKSINIENLKGKRYPEMAA